MLARPSGGEHDREDQAAVGDPEKRNPDNQSGEPRIFIHNRRCESRVE